MAATLALIWAMSEGGMFFTSCRARHLEGTGWSDGALARAALASPPLSCFPQIHALLLLPLPQGRRPSLSAWPWL